MGDKLQTKRLTTEDRLIFILQVMPPSLRARALEDILSALDDKKLQQVLRECERHCRHEDN